MRSAPSPAAAKPSPALAPTKLPNLPWPNPNRAVANGDQKFPPVSSSEAKDAGTPVGVTHEKAYFIYIFIYIIMYIILYSMYII
jgi:hypothetical protein